MMTVLRSARTTQRRAHAPAAISGRDKSCLRDAAIVLLSSEPSSMCCPSWVQSAIPVQGHETGFYHLTVRATNELLEAGQS
jgi:hypothetical protein